MAVAGNPAVTELWAKVKDGFGRKLNLIKASTTNDVQLRNNAGTNLASVTLGAATETEAGLMTAADRTKMAGIADGATANAASSTTPLADGTASAGSEAGYARGDHRHPTDATRAPLDSPALTGVPTAPTAAAGTATTQLATCAFVDAAIQNAQVGAATYQGVVDSNTEISGSSYKRAWYWIVGTAGTYVGQACEVGDTIYAKADKGPAYDAADFNVLQTNTVEMTAAEVDAICTF